MTVVVVEPRKRPYMKNIDNSLTAMQELVDGCIKALYPYEDPVALVCNEEGKLLGLEQNRVLYDEDGIPCDIICGIFFVVGLGEEDFSSLPKELAVKYLEVFWDM